jgi:Fe-S-cluster-containing hydrogenase component 2
MSNVYRRLREQLDHYSFGFPATASGVELKLLKRLFRENEAEIFLHMDLVAETPEAIAKRMEREPIEVSAILEQMAEKGLAFRLRKASEARYAAVPFVAGIFEFQLGTMDRELAELVEQYSEEAFHAATAEGATFLRPVPINRSISLSRLVSTYDDSRELIRKQDRIAVANCICRLQQGLLDQACDKPLEVCFIFGSWAQYYMDRHMARQVSVAEALEILNKAEEAGLVTQPANSQSPSALCNCCGDCCAVLRALNRHPRPAELVLSNYYAVVDQDLCTGCRTCEGRCQMKAVEVHDDLAEVNLGRCIGCGLCVTTCPGDAISLELKPESQRKLPPEKASRVLVDMAEKRGRSLVPFTFRKQGIIEGGRVRKRNG